ncbi:unnamed protein product [Amoebophrya sp. A120]|nr:unnamed protein product [Amoebophrya sp. A120]|eukprot:GSA120T00015934001.1
MNALEKVVKNAESSTNPHETTLTKEQTIRKCMDVLCQVLAQDLKAQDLEVGVVSENEPFRLLSAAEIDDHLTAIHEQD